MGGYYGVTWKLKAQPGSRSLPHVPFMCAQAAELMAGWVPIDTADALELLSPAFKNEEVRGLSFDFNLQRRCVSHAAEHVRLQHQQHTIKGLTSKEASGAIFLIVYCLL